MRAAHLKSGRVVVVEDAEEPRPLAGQLLVQVKACGICGSDVHFASEGPEMIRLGAEMPAHTGGLGLDIDFDREILLGHEFVGEVLELGPGTPGPRPGALVTSVPHLETPAGVRPIGLSNDVPAGFGERMLLSGSLAIEVPNGLDAHLAALAEPLAVGVHAVALSGMGAGDAAVVLGCGPIGLAVIAALRQRQVETVIAADLSSERRRIALAMGATEAVDPSVEPAFEAWHRLGLHGPATAFDAVGAPGIIDGVLRDAPRGSRLVVLGVCLQADQITPLYGVNKEMILQFSLAYNPDEFAVALRAIAEGEVDLAPMITATVPLEGVAEAFDDLSRPGAHCKVLVTP